MENYFLICCETYVLTTPGKNSFISLNSLLITSDGSILLVLWPGFLQRNVPFRKVIRRMLSLHDEAAASLCDRLEGREGWGVKPNV